MKILYYTGFFRDALASAEGFDPTLVNGLCEIVTDRTKLAEADAVVFHLPNLRSEELPEKRPGQTWVALSVEADANYPYQADEGFMRNFDVRMGLRQDCEIPLTYFRPHMLSSFRSPPRWKFRRATAVYVGSNPKVGHERADWLGKLAGRLKVDRYGKGNGSRRLWWDRGRETKLRVISRYAFHLVFENALERDYVSEKVYDALAAGTVPVYLGAPNVEEFLPAPKCAIFARDFGSADELADHLLDVRADRRRYDEYLQWRREPFAESFERLVELNAEPSIVRLYRRLNAGITPLRA